MKKLFATLGLFVSCMAADGSTIARQAVEPNGSILEAKAYEAALNDLKWAVAFINPELTAKALKQLEYAGANLPVLPYLQMVEAAALNNHVAVRVCQGLYGGVGVVCLAAAAANLLGCNNGRRTRGPDGYTLWPQNERATETVEMVNQATRVTRTTTFERVGWRDQMTDVGVLTIAGVTIAFVAWLLKHAEKADMARAREVAGLLLSSPAMVVGNDQEQVSAILKKLGIVFFLRS